MSGCGLTDEVWGLRDLPGVFGTWSGCPYGFAAAV